MSLQPGKHVTENLRLVRMLGRGAMGSVWIADHLSLQSQVAVKFMSQTHLDDPVSVQRFRQEARAAAEIRSPHVVQVFDHGVSAEGLPFIVMELLDGESLEKRVKRIGPLSRWEMARVLGQSCKGLAKAHERGILHRDIKPPNIFLIDAGGEPFVKVLDFGVAKFSGEESMEMTAAGHMVGTPAYMSPEQLFEGKEVDHRGDLWSMAVVAYWALTGQRPFEGMTLGELCVAIKRGEFVLPSSMRNDLSVDIDLFFQRAFHRDLARRFSTAKEMAQAFENAAGVSTTMQSTPSGVAQLMTYSGTYLSSRPLPAPRRARWPLLVAALCVLGIAIGAVAFLSGRDEEAASVASDGPPVEDKSEPKPKSQPDKREPTPSATAEPAASTSAPLPAPKAPTRWPAKPPPADDREEKAAKTLGI